MNSLALGQTGLPMMGRYTLNNNKVSSDTNFTSFTHLADSLNLRGINGPVVIDIISPPNIDESFVLSEIQGASQTNTITINGNGNRIWHVTDISLGRSTVLLDGADWITIDSLVIDAVPNSPTSGGTGVMLTNNANHNQILNCVITSDTLTDNIRFSGLAIAALNSSTLPGNGIAGSHNTIKYNIIRGGYYGVVMFGGPINSNENNVIINNKIIDAESYGIYINKTRNTYLVGNDIYHKNRFNNDIFEAIFDLYGFASKILGNRIHDDHSHDQFTKPIIHGIRIFQPSATAQDSIVVANNLIYGLDNNGHHTYISIKRTNYTKIVHNTIVIVDNSQTNNDNGSTIGIDISDSLLNSNIQNNILYIDRPNPFRSTHLIRYTAGKRNSVIDNNVYYVPYPLQDNDFFALLPFTEIRTLSEWQNNTGNNLNSSWIDPQFKDIINHDLEPVAPSIEGTGADFTSEVPLDVFGEIRTLPVDPGAIKMRDNTFSINERDSPCIILIYPNPADSYIYLRVTDISESGVVEFFNFQGKLVLKSRYRPNESISVRDLPKGIYIAKLTLGDKQENRKVVIE